MNHKLPQIHAPTVTSESKPKSKHVDVDVNIGKTRDVDDINVPDVNVEVRIDVYDRGDHHPLKK